MLEVLAERLEPGLVLASSYRLERVVGEGGMGVVWAARETASGREVALKFLRDGREADSKNRERFIREARAAMTIAHPNVAKVDAVLETDVGTPFIVMELLRGESLRELLVRRRALPPIDTARILLPVVDAVEAAHTNRIVHRDLKPENVFLVEGRHVRVLDFGIAKRIAGAGDTMGASTATNLTSTGAILGTPLYMAPEQVFGDDDIDGRADVWALGIMLYECLSGRRPTDADGFGQIVKRITTDPLEPLDRTAPEVPKIVSRLVMRMLSRDRAGRPPLAEVRAVLQRVLSGAPLDDLSPSTQKLPPIRPAYPPPNAPTPFASPAPKSTVPVAPIVAAIVVVLVAGFVVVRQVMLKIDEAKRASTTQPTPATPGTPAAPTTTDVPDWREALKATDRARDAMNARKGTECLKELDRYDTSFPNDASTKSTSVYADLRAQCLMLAGRCNEGKALARKRIEETRAGTAVDSAVEDEVAQYCEGREVSEREDLVRAIRKMNDANWNQDAKAPTSAECKAWHATMVALLPKVKSTSPADPVRSIEDDQGDRAAGRCYAKAKDCPTALAVLRARTRKEGVTEEWEPRAFADILQGTTCVPK